MKNIDVRFYTDKNKWNNVKTIVNPDYRLLELVDKNTIDTKYVESCTMNVFNSYIRNIIRNTLIESYGLGKPNINMTPIIRSYYIGINKVVVKNILAGNDTDITDIRNCIKNMLYIIGTGMLDLSTLYHDQMPLFATDLDICMDKINMIFINGVETLYDIDSMVEAVLELKEIYNNAKEELSKEENE